jgi:hypothetical protein
VSTDALDAPVTAPVAPPKRKKKRRRRRFSLNGLAIQLSAFALSFTLVALLVVSGSQQAFVQENEAVTNYVPIGTTEAPPGAARRRTPASAPSPAAPSAGSETASETLPEPEPEVAPLPTTAPEVPSTVITLDDSDAGTAMFGIETTLAPGVRSARCIEVDYSGNAAPEAVRLYAVNAVGGLAPYLDLIVEMGTAAAGSFGSCGTFVPGTTLYSGTLAGFATAHSGYASGLPTWAPTEDAAVRAFRFTVEVQDVAAAEGKTVAFGFSWETRDES